MHGGRGFAQDRRREALAGELDGLGLRRLDLAFERVRLDHEINDRGGQQRRERPETGGAEPACVGEHLTPSLDLVLYFRVGKRRLRLLDLDLEGGTVRRAAEPQHGAAAHNRVVVGRHAVDINVALAFEVDAIVAGALPFELEMLLADDRAFRWEDNLAVGLATELDAGYLIVEMLLLAGERAFEVRDGDGHGLAGSRFYGRLPRWMELRRGCAVKGGNGANCLNLGNEGLRGRLMAWPRRWCRLAATACCGSAGARFHRPKRIAHVRRARALRGCRDRT